MGNLRLRFWSLVKLGFETLRVDIVLELHNVEQLPLKRLQGFFKLRILRAHLLEKFFLVLTNHQVKVGLPTNLAKFESGIRFHL
jgi:hypothetical protein